MELGDEEVAGEAANELAEDLHDLVRARIENLRLKLLDLSRRNPLISTRLSPRSNSIVRVVDELPDVLAFSLCNQQKMRFVPLPPLEEDPKDEESREFQDALSNACLTDEIYLHAIEELNAKEDESIDLSRRIERELRDRVRADLGMAPRQTRNDISLPQHALNNGISPSYDLPDPSDEHEDGRHGDENIQTLLLPADLERKLNALTSKCRTWIQETGINVLHVAFGFLEWSEPNSTDSAFAPLVLLPIEIEKIKTPGGAEFWARANGDDTETNLVLAEKLRLEFGIDLPKFQGGSVEQYFQEVTAASPKTLKWRVRRQVAFGVFPSARIAMYHDLDTSQRNFEDRVVISSLFGGSVSAGAVPFAEEYDVDQPEFEDRVPFLVRNANSSQLSTMIDVANGKNLAVEGPPGTGKSETIVNTIAAAIADGKKVLFVAEKMAALEVVKSRLEAVGLGEYLLPLQATRSTREQVIDSIRERLAMDAGSAPREFEATVQGFRQTRSELAAYIETITAPFGKTGLTVHDVLGKSIATSGVLDEAPRPLHSPQIAQPEQVDPAQLKAVLEAGLALSKARRELDAGSTHWQGLAVLNLEQFTADKILQLAEDASGAFDAASQAREQLSNFAVASNTGRDDLTRLLEGVDSLANVVVDVDLPLISAICRVSRAEVFVDFLEACRLCQTRNADTERVVRDPNDPQVSMSLRRISTICEEHGIDSLDVTEWQNHLSLTQRSTALIARAHEALQSFIDVFPAAGPIPTKDIRSANQLIRVTEPRVLAARSEVTADPNAITLLRHLGEKGRALCKQWQRISEVLSDRSDLTSSQLAAYITSLRNAGPVAWLSSSFRSAKRAYIAQSRRAKFDKDEAAQDLQDLAEWKEAARSFLDDPQARALYGIHFKGVDTDFDLFNSLADFYEVGRQRICRSGEPRVSEALESWGFGYLALHSRSSR